MPNNDNNKVELGFVPSFILLSLAAYGAGTAGTKVANVIVTNLKKR